MGPWSVLPIKEAVYNSAVTLSIDKTTKSEFYSSIEPPKLAEVKLNGVVLSADELFSLDDSTFVFNESGYYEVTFEASSKDANVGKLRAETYQFTILNPNEHRYSYILNRYSNYYIEKVVKDGIDITENLKALLNVQTISIDNITYLTSLPLSSTDIKTGAGTYLITVNSNDSSLKNSLKYTYQIKILTGTAPIKVSISEGDSTTKKYCGNIQSNKRIS